MKKSFTPPNLQYSSATIASDVGSKRLEGAADSVRLTKQRNQVGGKQDEDDDDDAVAEGTLLKNIKVEIVKK